MARRFTRTPLTDAERDARRRADRDRLEQAARALLTTDRWQRWIKVRATNGLSRYSLAIPASDAAFGKPAFNHIPNQVRDAQRAGRSHCVPERKRRPSRYQAGLEDLRRQIDGLPEGVDWLAIRAFDAEPGLVSLNATGSASARGRRAETREPRSVRQACRR